MIYHLIVHNMKNINFQVKFHVFCMFEKKACFIPILVNRVGLTAGLITTIVRSNPLQSLKLLLFLRLEFFFN